MVDYFFLKFEEELEEETSTSKGSKGEKGL